METTMADLTLDANNTLATHEAETWAERFAAYGAATKFVNSIDSEKDLDGFDAAAEVHGEKIEALLKFPAPDLAAITTKMQVIQKDGYQHMMAPVLTDLERLSGSGAVCDPTWGQQIGNDYLLPDAFPGISVELAEAADAMRTAHFDQTDDAGLMLSNAAKNVANITARSTSDIAAKVLLGLFECEPSQRNGRLAVDIAAFSTDNAASILISAAREAGALSPPAENPALVEAFHAYRAAFAELGSTDPDVEDESFFKIADPADQILKTAKAMTAKGVAMKLKRSFGAIVGLDWSDDAVLDTRTERFAQGLLVSDLYHQMLWSAVEDLEQMAEQAPLVRPTPSEKQAWDAALGQYRRAWALWSILVGDYANEAADAVSAIALPALETLIETPAPTLAALVIKMEETSRGQREVNSEDWDQIISDARRLAGMEA
jgi:hypothetical protein